MMNKRNKNESSRKAGLTVRYCFDGVKEPAAGSEEEGEEGEEEDCVSEVHQAATQRVEKKSLESLPRPNYWFYSGPGTDFKRPAHLGHACRPGTKGKSLAGGDSKDWHGNVEADPGFFVTDKITQPSTEDLLSWDSGSYVSSSDEDIRDNFGRNNTARGLVSKDRGPRSSTLTAWASHRPPVPPAARDVSANKAEETEGAPGSQKKTIENTYRLEPKSGQVFIWYKMKRPMVSLVDQLLDEFVYNVKSGPSITRKLSEVIMKMVKKTFEWPRYKYVCSVYLAQLKNQGIMIADRALWNTTYDNVACYTYKNKDIVCVVTFHALYFE